MIHQRVTVRSLFLLASFVACITLAACGGDDTSDAQDSTPQGTDETTPGATSDGSDGSDGPEENTDGSDGSDDTTGGETASGTLTLDGATYSFEPTLCLPDVALGSSVSGAGTAEDGTPMYVDMAAGDLSVYLGTDDPMSADPDYVANGLAGQGSLDETVDGSTLSVEASFTEHASTEVVAEGSLEVTC